MKKSFLQKRGLFGIRNKELFIFLSFYLFFAFFYHFTLWVNRRGWENYEKEDILFHPLNFFDDSGLDYLVKLLVTIPFWWLLFRKLKHWSLTQRLLLHIFLLPAFVFIWQQLYYLACDAIGFGHLGGSGQIWDIYIPALFYVVQFGILHSYEYYLENQRKLRIEGELRTAALKSELSALKAQLNPHFLYNVFNTISASVPPEQEKTRNLIAELSDLFRYQLKASMVESVSLREELEFVQKYLQLEQERFQERLTVTIDVEAEILEEKIPPMLLQPIVENSVKHGLSSLIDGGEISIKIFKRNDKLCFEIADTGVGISDKTGVFEKGVGLANTKKRLEKMYNSTLYLTDNLPQGVKIKFSI